MLNIRSFKLTAGLSCWLILVIPFWANATDFSHADPSLIHNNTYGPVRPNDTLWSIARLFCRPGESITQVMSELKAANPNSIKQDSIVLAGLMISRQSVAHVAISHDTASPSNPVNSPADSSLTTNTEPQTPTQIVAAIPVLEPALTNPQPVTTPIEPPLSAQQAATSSTADTPNNFGLYGMLALILGLLATHLWLRRLKHRKAQLAIEQAERDQMNALKRIAIKNRLKPNFNPGEN